MSITSTYEGSVVVNSVEDDDSLVDILDYASRHIDEWRKCQVIWDMTLLNFQELSGESIRSFILRGASFTKKRSGMKTALLVDSDLGFGMMRMLQIIAEDKVHVIFKVFRSKGQALQWLAEDDESTESAI